MARRSTPPPKPPTPFKGNTQPQVTALTRRKPTQRRRRNGRVQHRLKWRGENAETAAENRGDQAPRIQRKLNSAALRETSALPPRINKASSPPLRRNDRRPPSGI